MQIEITTDLDDLDVTVDEWNRLVAENETNTVFQTFQWFDCWWRNFSAGYKPLLISVRDNDELVGIAPLMIAVEPGGRKVLRFACDLNSDYCDFIIIKNKGTLIELILQAVFDRPVDFDLISLINIPSVSTTHDYLVDICDRLNIPARAGRPGALPRLLIRNRHDDVCRILKKYSVRRPLNKLERLGEVRLHIFRSDALEELKTHLPLFMDQHIRRYEDAGEISPFVHDSYRQFYFDLVESMRDQPWISFSLLEVGGKALAYHFGFSYGDRLIWYKPSFDIDYHRFSPGSALLKLLIEHTVDTGFNELDYTIGAEAYKQRFSNAIAYNKNLTIYRSASLYSLHRSRSYLLSLARLIRSKPIGDVDHEKDSLQISAHSTVAPETTDSLLAIADLQEQWNQAATRSPTQSFEWYSACELALNPRGAKVLLLRDIETDLIDASIPLVPGNVILGQVGYETLGQSMLGEPFQFVYTTEQALDHLLKSIAELKAPVHLERYPADISVKKKLARNATSSGFCLEREGQGSQYLPLPDSVAEFEASMSSRRRQDLRRYHRKAWGLGDAKVRVLSPDVARLDPLLELAFDIEHAGWKGKNGSSILSRPALALFLRRYCGAMAAQGRLAIGLLQMDNRDVAMQIAVRACHRLWLLKIGYDERYREQAPGILLTHYMIRYAIEHQLTSVEFLGYSEDWIGLWQPKEHRYRSSRIYPLNASGVVHFGADVAGFAANRLMAIITRVATHLRPQ